jgi:hypothetical protein
MRGLRGTRTQRWAAVPLTGLPMLRGRKLKSTRVCEGSSVAEIDFWKPIDVGLRSISREDFYRRFVREKETASRTKCGNERFANAEVQGSRRFRRKAEAEARKASSRVFKRGLSVQGRNKRVI